jgi:hypothetical protein
MLKMINSGNDHVVGLVHANIYLLFAELKIGHMAVQE